jgi:hypothetical protein
MGYLQRPRVQLEFNRKEAKHTLGYLDESILNDYRFTHNYLYQRGSKAVSKWWDRTKVNW